MSRFLCMLVLALVLTNADAAPVAARRATPTLRAGEYLWHPEAAPEGPVVVVVSLEEQRAYVYRNGIAIGLATISSGREGHETPTGVFTILQKDREHYSTKYDNAPMPYMERLTWDGIALHGGALPGYPASHGCIRLPQAFAERLFAITQRGETVVVADARTVPAQIAHPALLSPVDTRGMPLDSDTTPGDAYTWDPSASPDGPISILVSVHDRRVHVLRNGILIGSGALKVSDGFHFSGSMVLVMLQAIDDAPSPLDPTRRRHRWEIHSLRGSAADTPSIDSLSAGLRVPDGFAQRVYSVLSPGTSILVTDLPAFRGTTDGHRDQEHVLESSIRDHE